MTSFLLIWCGSYKKKSKTHVGPLYLYALNRRLVHEILEAANDGSFWLGASMDQKWTDVARRIWIQKEAVGWQPKKSNGGRSLIVKLDPLASFILKDVCNIYPKSKSISRQRFWGFTEQNQLRIRILATRTIDWCISHSHGKSTIQLLIIICLFLDKLYICFLRIWSFRVICYEIQSCVVPSIHYRETGKGISRR